MYQKKVHTPYTHFCTAYLDLYLEDQDWSWREHDGSKCCHDHRVSVSEISLILVFVPGGMLAEDWLRTKSSPSTLEY